MSEQEKKSSILDKRSSRRKFIKNSGLTVGGLVLGGAIGSLVAGKPENITKAVDGASHATVDYSETRQFFVRQKDFEALSAATEIIYPEDEHGPGAISLGAPFFIDKQLASPWGSNADDYRKGPFQKGEIALDKSEIMLQGVRKLNEVAEKEHDGTVFKDLTEEQQIAILTSFEAGKVEMELVNSAAFFGLLRTLTLQGCFADPLYGGNKNMAGWKMKEFPGAQMSYTAYLDKDEFVLIDPISLGGHKQH
ncbi:gluconate 2-dehydrogenase subunit 3 family protein [Bacillus sp. Cr_A10]|jgi:gluconate 2-dehydrogenase gamma chain|uniref:gluconate 2-dehydrogenase subunit 3 family protein n=1 Tax=Bacillaceae TaxID=186817 RepID=UPI0023DA93D2|nr:gluconate 2-dehydrogenase subunit 3 family protein [Bacillus sp. Cr_A10]MDF2065606.1 gluconate 2-dehydrogenase subunit 3 family protein [Bacillus sp. Cr_A10]